MNVIADDRFWGWDKLDHFAWSFAYWVLLRAVTSSLLLQLGLFAIGAIGVELVELYRYWRWTRRGSPPPWPVLTDRISWRDLLWNAAGALAGAGALARIR